MQPVLLLLGGVLACSPQPSTDTGVPGGALPLSIRDRCFAGIGDDALGFPDYDQFGPTVPEHCMGTNHQDIDGIERVVFIGDSITAGTPPTPEDEIYRARLGVMLTERFGDGLVIDDCSEWGARTDDLLQHEDRGLPACFPDGGDSRRTLIVMTIGGNDMLAAADAVASKGTAAGAAVVEDAIATMDEALAWIRQGSDLSGDHPELSDRFPAGAFVVFGNVYEYTDGTGDLGSCPTAELLGFDYTVPELRDGYIWIDEAFVELAVRYRMDAIFMLEHFCGHGFHAGEPDNECYRGDDAETWFDDSCIHPNPTGHGVLADMFFQTITW